MYFDSTQGLIFVILHTLYCAVSTKWLWLWCLMPLSTIFQLISLWSVLLVEETGVPVENQQPATSHWQTLSHNVVSSTPHLSGIQTHKVSDVRNWSRKWQWEDLLRLTSFNKHLYTWPVCAKIVNHLSLPSHYTVIKIWKMLSNTQNIAYA